MDDNWRNPFEEPDKADGAADREPKFTWQAKLSEAEWRKQSEEPDSEKTIARVAEVLRAQAELHDLERTATRSQRNGLYVLSKLVEELNIAEKNEKPFCKLVLVSGTAGTGKTRLAAGALIGLAEFYGQPLALTATTHAAVDVLEEAVGVDARTVHSLLKLAPGEENSLSGFAAGAEDEFRTFGDSEIPDYAIVLLDEASMASEEILAHLMASATKANALVVLVGDPAQLPPVSDSADKETGLPKMPFVEYAARYGAVFVRLEERMRQTADSPIIKLAELFEDASDYGPTRSLTRKTFESADWRVSTDSGDEGVFVADSSGASVAAFLDTVRKYGRRFDDRETVFLAPTNREVIEINRQARRIVHGPIADSLPYLEGEIFIAQTGVQNLFKSTNPQTGEVLRDPVTDREILVPRSVLDNGQRVIILNSTASSVELDGKSYPIHHVHCEIVKPSKKQDDTCQIGVMERAIYDKAIKRAKDGLKMARALETEFFKEISGFSENTSSAEDVLIRQSYDNWQAAVRKTYAIRRRAREQLILESQFDAAAENKRKSIEQSHVANLKRRDFESAMHAYRRDLYDRWKSIRHDLHHFRSIFARLNDRTGILYPPYARTVHKSQGSSADTVFFSPNTVSNFLGGESGANSWRTGETQKDREARIKSGRSQRRAMMYVAITRARRRLFAVFNK